MEQGAQVTAKVTTISESYYRDGFVKALQDKFVYTGQKGSQAYFLDLDTMTSGLTKQHLIRFLVDIGADWAEAKGALKFCDRAIRPVAGKRLYRPGAGQVVRHGGLYFLNLWQEPSVAPDSKVSPEPFIQHLVMALGSEEKANYLIDALAFRFQAGASGAKPHIAFYLYGEAQGQGKSLLAKTIRQVFGDSAIRIVPSADKLKSMSAVDMWMRTWLVTEETEVKRGSELYDTIKSYTGMDRTESDRKNTHFDTYEIPAQLIMLSNNVPSFIETNDRRFFVSQWDTRLRGDDKKRYFDEYIQWLENGGYEAIAGLLEQRTVNYDLFREAMVTQEKLRAQNLASDESVEALKAILEDAPQNALFQPCYFDAVWERHDVRANQQKHKLAAAGLMKVSGRVQINNIRYSGLWMFADSVLVSEQGSKPRVETKDRQVMEAILYSDMLDI